VKAHNDGRAAAHTYKRRPVSLVYSEVLESETAAVTRGALPPPPAERMKMREQHIVPLSRARPWRSCAS
jgi:hypothetical protein